MKTIAVLFALVAVAFAAPQLSQPEQPPVVLVKETPSNNIGLDGYQFGYQLSDGQSREESAQVETRAAISPNDESTSILRVRGSFSYVAADGKLYTVTYIADENGFQPQGEHLPVAPVA